MPIQLLLHGFLKLSQACQCALGLATAMSIMVGSGRMAQAGVLVKDARAIEEMNKVETD